MTHEQGGSKASGPAPRIPYSLVCAWGKDARAVAEALMSGIILEILVSTCNYFIALQGMLNEYGINEPKETDREKGWTLVTKKRCKQNPNEVVDKTIANTTMSANFKKNKENTFRKSKADGSKSIKTLKLRIPLDNIKNENINKVGMNNNCKNENIDNQKKEKEQGNKKTCRPKSKILCAQITNLDKTSNETESYAKIERTTTEIKTDNDRDDSSENPLNMVFIGNETKQNTNIDTGRVGHLKDKQRCAREYPHDKVVGLFVVKNKSALKNSKRRTKAKTKVNANGSTIGERSKKCLKKNGNSRKGKIDPRPKETQTRKKGRKQRKCKGNFFYKKGKSFTQRKNLFFKKSALRLKAKLVGKQT